MITLREKVVFPGDNDLFSVCPQAEKTWDHEQNTALGLNPIKLLKSCDKYAHFICEHGHDEFRKVKDYVNHPYCLVCAKLLIINYPITALFLDLEENTKDDINDYLNSDRRMLHLKCPHCGYMWEWRAYLWRKNLYCPHCGFDGSEGSCERNSFVKEKYKIVTLKDANPKMAAFWDYKKNGKKGPESIAAKSNKKFSFICDNKHYFDIEPFQLFDKAGNPIGCPYCEGRRTWVTSGINDFLTVVPLAKEYWDYDNNTLDPTQYLSTVNKDANFKCILGHKFTTKIRDFTNDPHCPTCREAENQRLFEFEQKRQEELKKIKKQKEYVNSFAYNKPKAAKLWNYELNGDRTPENIPQQANKPVYLNCYCGKHEPYSVSPFQVKNEPYGCPGCRKEAEEARYNKYSLAIQVPISEKMWDKEKNKMQLKDAKIYMSDTAHFICDEGHSFPRTIREYVKNQTCPICNMDSCIKHPQIMRCWNYEKNEKRGLDPNTTASNSDNPADWRCKKCGYEWESSISSRKLSKGLCPCCEVKIVVVAGISDLFTVVPNIIKSYAFEANEKEGIVPEKLSVSSEDFVNWVCPDCGYKWRTRVCSRVKKNEDGTYYLTKCPVCAGRVRTKPYVEEYPELRERFNKELNTCSIDSIITGKDAEKKYYWDCDICGETFPASVVAIIRALNTKSKGCPYCSGKEVLSNNSFAALHPELMDEYAPENTIDPYNVTEYSNLYAIWFCRNDSSHRWPASFDQRARGFGKCTICKDYNCEIKFYEKYPQYESWYDTEKNKRPFNSISLKSNETLWWKCPEHGHSFPRKPCNIDNTGKLICPYCSNVILLTGFNDLATKRADLLRFYDYEANVLPPEEMIINSRDENTWWYCDNGHRFQRSVFHMCETTYCPICDTPIAGVNTLETVIDDIEKIWSKTNERHYSTLLPKFVKYADWICRKCGGIYPEQINEYVDNFLSNNEENCPYCKGDKALAGFNTLETVLDDIQEVWSSRNNRPYTDFLPSYKIVAYWNCKTCGGEYPEAIDSFIEKHLKGEDTCPFCSLERPLAGFNTLETVLDDIDEIWADNNERLYTELLPSYKIVAYWKCKTCGGVYPEAIDSFIEKHLKGEDDCPYCQNRKPLRGFNTIKAINPPWFKEWSYQYNYLICDPDEVLPTYTEKVWFECSICNHEYFMSPKDRETYEMRHKIACPYCKGLRRKKRYFF